MIDMALNDTVRSASPKCTPFIRVCHTTSRATEAAAMIRNQRTWLSRMSGIRLPRTARR